MGWRKQLLYVQKCITMLNMTGLIECIAWWTLYSEQNARGEYRNSLFLAAALLSVWKAMICFRIVLVSSLSRDPMVADEEDSNVGMKVHVSLMLYMIADFNFRHVLSYKHSHFLTQYAVIKNAVPLIVMGGLLFLWSHKALSDMTTAMRAKGEEKKASLFGKTQAILCVATFCAIVVIALQLFDPTLDDTPEMWRYHFIVTDGASQGIFAIALCVGMVLWLSRESIQGYRYVQQSSDDG